MNQVMENKEIVYILMGIRKKMLNAIFSRFFQMNDCKKKNRFYKRA